MEDVSCGRICGNTFAAGMHSQQPIHSGHTVVCMSLSAAASSLNAVLSFGAERYPQMTLANCCRGLDFIRKKQYKRSLHNGVFAAGKLLLVLVIF